MTFLHGKPDAADVGDLASLAEMPFLGMRAGTGP
jgi:hypothetical protein